MRIRRRVPKWNRILCSLIPGIIASGGGSSAPAGAIGDPFFDEVVASLHFDGTDGSTTFTDVKGHTFSAVNNAQLDTAQSKFGGASLLLDGTNDYITAPDSSDWDLGAGDFTLECWVRFNGDPGTAEMTFVAQYDTTGNQRGWVFGLNNNTLRFLYSTDGSSDATALTAAWNPAGSIWYHVRVTRFGANVFFFVDGQSLGSASIGAATTIFNSTALLQIGAHSLGASGDMNGWLDDLRITRNARNTKTFSRPVRANYDNLGIPSDELFSTAVSILHADVDFTDVKGVSWSAAGNAAIDSAQSRFGGASLHLDGTGDWLEATDSDFAFGTADFTIECWVRYDTLSGNNFAFTWGGGWGVYTFSGSWAVFDGSASNVIGPAGSVVADTWYHVALCRRGTSMRLFVDGVQVGSTATNSTNFSNTTIRIGAQPSGSGTMNGWVEDFRASNFARYVGAFQEPMRSHPNSYGDPHFDDVVSLNYWEGVDGATTYTDEIVGRTWTNGANGPTLVTAEKKFGVSSLKFPGTSANQINSDNGAHFSVGLEAFTIETWFRTPTVSGNVMIFDLRGFGIQPALYLQSGTVFMYDGSSVRISGANPMVINTWHHWVLTRIGNEMRAFCDGVQLGSTYTTPVDYSNSTRVRLGTNADTGGGFGDNSAWYDDFRFTKGTGRYTGNFSPPPLSFANAA